MECARGGLDTLLLDRGSVGSGTTGAGMGHIVIMDDSEAQFALTHYSRRLWIDMKLQFPPDVEYQTYGTLWVAADAEEMEEVYRKKQYYQERGVSVDVLDGPQLAKMEPNLRQGLAGALRVHDDAVVYQVCAAKYFLAQARALGADVRLNTAVTEILPEGGVLLADGSRCHANRIVNAAGSWSKDFDVSLPVRKRKGHLLITDRVPGFVHHQIIELGYLKSAHSMGKDSVAFNIQPRKTGQMLIGSSRQFDAAGDAVDHEVLGRMLERAAEYLPDVYDLPALRTWAGHRCATPDKLPLIGPSRDHDRIWLATGHEGLGITTSLGTGRLLADMLLGRETPIPSEPYSPARFKREGGRNE